MILFLAAFTQSCYYDNEEELYPFEANCDLPELVNYTEVIEPIIQGNCAVSGCHTGTSPTGGLFLDTYQQVKTIADNGDLSDRVLIQEDMPPSAPLSFCEQEAIMQWINEGAPEN